MMKRFMTLSLVVLAMAVLTGCGKKPEELAPAPARTWEPLTIEELSMDPALFQQRLAESNPNYRGGAEIGYDPQMGLIGQIAVPEVSNLAGLKDLPFAAMDLRGAAVSDISVLEGMPLKILGLEGTRVLDLSPLKGAPLVKLYLSGTPVNSIDALAGMPLVELMLVGTVVSNVGPLKGTPLTMLWLDGTKVADISPLADCPLVSLTLKDTMVADLSPLAGHATLQRLHVGGSKVTDLSPVKELPLTRLIFDPAAVTGWEAVVREMETLTEVGATLEERMPPADFLARYAPST